MTVEILYRPAEAGRETLFAHVAEVLSMPAAADELASWNGPFVHHGDLVRVVGMSHDRLFVFDGDVSAFKRVPKPLTVEFYEASDWDPARIFRQCGKVDERKRALVALDCVERALKLAGIFDKRINKSLDLKRSWALGEILRDDAIPSIASLALAIEGRSTKRVAANSVNYALSRQYAAAVDATARVHMDVLGVLEADRGPYAELCDIIRRHIPLSVAACAALTMRDPLPLPREPV